MRGMTVLTCAEVGQMAVLVTNDFPPDHGGIQRLMSQLARELARRNEHIFVIAPRRPGFRAFDSVQTYRIARYPGKSRIAGFAFMTAYTLWARLVSRDPLTIASMWFPAGLAACLVPSFMRGRLAVLAHGTEVAPTRGGIRRRVMQYVFNRADFIIANSNFTGQLLRQAGVTRAFAIVHPGIDARPIVPERSSVPTFLSVGRLIARKGFDTMINALPTVLQKYPSARYEIVGSGPQRAELEELAKRLGVEDHVVFLGGVDDAAMRAAYARAWLFALPARRIGNDVEGFGLVYLEAALASLPSIGGRDSGAEDAIVAGETGLLVDGASPAELAAAIQTILADRDAAQAMGVRARDRALEYFNWLRVAADFARLLNMPTATAAEPEVAPRVAP
jgi:phosphatidylinositol alpha-1,6-mannosyltransferase